MSGWGSLTSRGCACLEPVPLPLETTPQAHRTWKCLWTPRSISQGHSAYEVAVGWAEAGKQVQGPGPACCVLAQSSRGPRSLNLNLALLRIKSWLSWFDNKMFFHLMAYSWLCNFKIFRPMLCQPSLLLSNQVADSQMLRVGLLIPIPF